MLSYKSRGYYVEFVSLPYLISKSPKQDVNQALIIEKVFPMKREILLFKIVH